MAQPFAHLPQHVGIIMDGNRRWARQHGLEALQGHDYVSEKMIEPLVDRCLELGIPYLTLWAFSTENWDRDQKEVEGLMHIFRKSFEREGRKLHEKGVRLRAIGDLQRFPKDIQAGVQHWLDESKNNKRITVTFALNYGGRDEIMRAMIKTLQSETSLKESSPKEVEAVFAEHLDTAGMPDVDLIIRTGGEQRTSGFLPWQSVYAELYFTPTLMPEFTPTELDKALANFSNRNRRFGK
jgi:undecaprenyl diphosphate synthase